MLLGQKYYQTTSIHRHPTPTHVHGRSTNNHALVTP